MKILHVAETAKGGVATVMNELIANQIYLYGSEKVTLIIPKDHEEFIPSASDVQVFSYERTGRNFSSFISLIKIITSVISKSEFDIIHLHSTFAGLFGRIVGIFLKPKGKIIYCPHAFSFLMDVGVIKKVFYSLVEFILQVNTEKIICVSNYEKEEAKKRFLNDDKMVVIYNGVHEEEDFSWNVDKFVGSPVINITFVGRFDFQKGIDILYSSILSLSESTDLIYNYKFHIVGDIVQSKDSDLDFEKIKNNNIEIIMYGWLDKIKLREVYEKSHLVVMPSRWESFGLVVAESFQYGVPVVVSNNSSLYELVDEGATGYFIETGDAEGLAVFFEKISLNELMCMSHNCRKSFLEKFTSKVMLKSVNDLYAKVG